jgi:MFS family permease
VLLGALGVGAVGGAFLLPRLRARLSNNALVVTASIVYAVVLVAVVSAGDPIVAVVVLLPAGVAWIAVISAVNASLQLFLPAWVRARGLSVYLTVLFGSQAFGAVLWGALAVPLGLVATFLTAAAVMVAGVATIRVWPLIETEGMDRSTVVYWPAPELTLDVEPEGGPVLVRSVYTVSPDRERPFLAAMADVRRSRLRTGAVRWGLFRDGEQPDQFVELFVVPSWEEHQRQHTERLTGADRQAEQRADALSDPSPRTSHLIAADLPDRASPR